MYVTPTRYRNSGSGVDLTGVDDGTLRNMLERSSAIVDSYCAIPQLPQKYDFRGGTVTDERHTWHIGDVYDVLYTQNPSIRRVYLFQPPIRSVSSFVVKFTNTYSVTIDPTQLYINPQVGWAEVVSLSAIVTGVYPIGLNFGLFQPIAEVDYTYGYQFISTNETLTGDGAFTLYYAQNQWWDSTVPPVIKKNGGVITSGFTIDYDEGQLTFGPALLSTDVVTATYTYKLPSQIAQATVLMATVLIGESDIVARGMQGLDMLRVAEVTMSRYARRPGSGSSSDTSTFSLPSEVEILLSSFVFRTVR